MKKQVKRENEKAKRLKLIDLQTQKEFETKGFNEMLRRQVKRGIII